MRNRALLLCLLLATACGKKKTPRTQQQTQQQQPEQQPEQQPPQETPPPAPTPSPSNEDLKKKRAELGQKIQELEKAKKELDAQHEKEKQGFDLGLLRRTYIQAITDARSKENEFKRLRERQEELKKFAESAARGKVKELRDERAKIRERQDAIQDAWRSSQAEERLGGVQESPVKKDLDTIRAVKQQWFQATPLARRGTAKDNEKQIINDGFRGWLGEVPDRKRVVDLILGLPQAPKGKTTRTYDFTDLKFFVLMELMEEQLERQNVAVEKKELAEARAKLDAIEAELDAVDAKIHEQMVAGGDELQEYEEILDRLPAAQQAATYMSTRVTELNQTLKRAEEMKERQERETDAALEAIEKARKELSALRN